MNKYKIIKDYINYYFKAKTKYSIHSPFVFDFVTNVLEQKKAKNELLNEIEKLRKELSISKTEIEVRDFGGDGYKKNKQKKYQRNCQEFC